ncbi:hypothetical protein KSK32_00610 [Micromonospora sp. WMMB482]|uniref:hypothetical protein n=1 Tax=Micromonospora sp. WMMB482 TaxID=2849653 RepID=UPI001C245273|nr:hypothetical protein [Micromonospora sp. WMMB482]MBU8855789.1 hypothetical protein [Micromonospora sp. WMMB482]
MRWPIAAAIVPTAAVGAKTGFGLPNRLNASHQDSAAARPACAAISAMISNWRSRNRPARLARLRVPVTRFRARRASTTSGAGLPRFGGG